MQKRVRYPYYERGHHSSEDRLQESVAEKIAAVSGPIIEIGGPTIKGFRTLRDRAVFSTRPVITNAPSPLGFAPEGKLDAYVDGTEMPYEDGTVGMFLASHLASTDMFKFITMRGQIGRAARSEKFWNQQAGEEYDHVQSDLTYPAYYNLRIAVLQEMTRTLTPGGLILFEGLHQPDVDVARALGHQVLQQEESATGAGTIVLDCVLQK